MNAIPATGRRALLKSAGFVGLAFAIPLDDAAGQAAPARPPLPGDLNTSRRLSAWIRIEADRRVTLLVGKVELGQGIVTALAQICADELDVDMARVSVISGDTALVPNQGVTAGSFSMPNGGTAVRHAAAEARQVMIELAAAKLGQPAEGMRVEDGVVIAATGARASYWELATGQALEREATGQTRFRAPEAYRYIGKSVPRLDIPAKVMGDPIFVQDLRPAGMLFGQVTRPPAYRARLVSVDVAAIEKMPGVVKVVRDGSFLAVIAQRQEQANAAAQALFAAARWEVEKGLPGHDGIFDWLLATKPAQDIEIRNQKRADGQTPARTLEATYLRPYHMHASIGPSAALATLGADGVLTVQTHSQSVFETRQAIARMLGMDLAKVRLQHVQGSGCYGHNMADDAAADAALLAVAMPGRPIRLQYTREQEHRWEPMARRW